jgi:hypothetical protein
MQKVHVVKQKRAGDEMQSYFAQSVFIFTVTGAGMFDYFDNFLNDDVKVNGSVILLCSVVFMAHVRYKFKQRFCIYYYVKTHTNHAGENFALNFQTQHVRLQIQFPN